MADYQAVTTRHFRTLAYRKSGSGPALMLVHGFPASGSLWDNVIPTLSAQFTVLVPDLPGTGRSELEGETTSMDELAEGLKAIIDQEGLERIVLAGHSMGGYVSLAFAARYPERLSGLSMVHSTARADNEEKVKTRQKAIELIRKGGKESFIRSTVPGLFAPAFTSKYPEVINRQVAEGSGLADAVLIAFYNAMINRPDRVHILQEAPLPVQWIIGKEDSIVPASGSVQQSILSDVSFVGVYDACGHMSMLEQPEKLASDLTGFTAYCTSGKMRGIN